MMFRMSEPRCACCDALCHCKDYVRPPRTAWAVPLLACRHTHHPRCVSCARPSVIRCLPEHTCGFRSPTIDVVAGSIPAGLLWPLEHLFFLVRFHRSTHAQRGLPAKPVGAMHKKCLCGLQSPAGIEPATARCIRRAAYPLSQEGSQRDQ